MSPEWPIYALLSGTCPPIALAGRVDAIAYDGERPDIVVDWKNDVDPTDKDMRMHANQLEDYLRATGAFRGALVYMTPGIIHWVAHPRGKAGGD